MKRWIILACCCTVISTLFYSFDNATVLRQQLYNTMTSYSEEEKQNFEYKFNLLFVFYSLPNIILPFFGGTLVDSYYGASKALLLFSSTCLVGHTIFTAGVANQSWSIIYFGRFIYGLGGECLFVSQSSVLAQTFSNHENNNGSETISSQGLLAFAFGISSSISWLGGVLNDWITPPLANTFGIITALSFGALVLSFGVFCAFIVVRLSDNVKQQNEQTKKFLGFNSIKNMNRLFWNVVICYLFVEGCILTFDNVASGILMERNYFISPSNESTCKLRYPNQCSMGYLQLDENPETCSTTEHKNMAPILPSSIYIQNTTSLSSSITTWYYSTYSFSNLTPQDVNCNDPFWSEACTKNYCIAQQLATEQAGRSMSIPYIFSALSVPLLGYVADKKGGLGIFLLGAPLTLVFVHLSLGFSSSKTKSVISPLLGQGLACALYTSAIWPSIPRIVSPQHIGMAYGIMTSLLNAALSIFPIIIALVYNLQSTYLPYVEVFFVICSLVGLICAIHLNILDYYRGFLLNTSRLQFEFSNDRITFVDGVMYDSTIDRCSCHNNDDDQESLTNVSSTENSIL